MEKTSVKIKSVQVIDNEQSKQIYDGESLILDETGDTLSVTYFNENKELVTLTLYFYNGSSSSIKIQTKTYNAILNFTLDEKTSGLYAFKDYNLELDFILKKFFKKGLDISFEYDIFTNGNLISHNLLEIEVKKC